MRSPRLWVALLFVPIGLTAACTALLGDFTADENANGNDGGSDGNTIGDGSGDGSATCTGTQTACGTDCADLQTTAAHCGNCATACPTGFSCSGGKCGNGIATMIAGGTSTCAVTVSGALYCWGDNTQGQIGVGDISMSHGTATLVAKDVSNNPFASLASVGLGKSHACAATAAGVPFCWGSNSVGQTATGNPSEDGGLLGVPSPTMASQTSTHFGGETKFVYSAMSTGAAATHQCAITKDAGVVCWGLNGQDELGHVDAGFDVDDPNCYDQFGDQVTCTSNPFPAVINLTGASVKQISTGDEFTCALDTKGFVSCWGAAHSTQLGNRSEFGNGPIPTPVAVLDGGNVTAISSGSQSSCALLSDGTVWCWGYTTDGEVGHIGSVDAGDLCCGVEGCFENSCFGSATVQVPGIANATSVSVGCDHVCATEKDGSVWCWGGNESGQLGSGASSAIPGLPAKVPGFTNAAGVVAGCGHTCAWTADGKASCWGLNDHGQIGNGSVNSPSPLPVQGLP